MAFAGGFASAQDKSPTDGSTPLGISPGAPAGSYPLSGFENVNAYSGNLNFHLPLVSMGGRGGAHSVSYLAIDATKWTVRSRPAGDDYLYSPSPNWWSPKAGYGPGIMMGRRSGTGTYGCGFSGSRYWQTLTRFTFTAGDGTEYEFRDQLTGGQPVTYADPCSASPASRGNVFITADGSAATFISDTNISDSTSILTSAASLIYPSGYLLLRDGTRFRIDGGNVTWMRDRNGNRISFTYDSSNRILTMTDSLNRTVTFSYADYTNTSYDKITYKGFGGADRTILINYAYLSSVLRTTNPRNEPASRYQIQTFKGLFPELNYASSTTSYDTWIVSSITLPNLQQYQLSYNSYGELARVTLPTSGAIEYDYTPGSGVADDAVIYRRVKERRVYADGTNLENYATFSELVNGVATVDQLSGSNVLLSRTKHYFYGDPVRSVLMATGTSYPAKLEGHEYKTENYAADGTTLLRSEQMTWVNRAPVSWWTYGADSEPPNDPRVTDITATLADVTPNLVSKHVFGYDDTVPYNNRNNFKEYDFGSGAPGALMRETRTTYLTATNYVDAFAGAHIRSLPSQSSIFDGGGAERSRITYEYDNYVSDANHAPLVPRSNISGLDAAFTNTYTTRGNATGTTHYLLDPSGQIVGSVSAYAQFDVAGNVVNTIDARGYVSKIDYSDNFGAPADAVESGALPANSPPAELSGLMSYAFPFAATNPLGQKAYFKVDYYSGRAVGAEDANGTTYSGYYNDVLDRPTQVIRAANNASLKSQSTFAYDDASRIVTVTSDQTTYGDNLLRGQTVYDGLGRTIEGRTYENSTQYISVQQVPFVMLQDPDNNAWVAAKQSSNPYRAYLGGSAVWTTTFFDSLGRGTKTRTPDNSMARFSYSGNTVTATDQTGKSRESISDALGRLIQVYEDPNASNFLTSYSYDVLDDLLTVSQGSQTRTFLYDSLKRLSSATNPENGTISYQYDPGGNVLVKTDARGVSSHYSYDVLSRITRSWYNGSTDVSATTNNSPALPNNVSASDEAAFFYDAQGLPNGAPTFTRGSSLGRLVAVTYGTGSSTGDYFGYDALGRDVLKIQQTGSINYQTSAIYSIAGALTTETLPSNHTVTYAFDGADRTASVTGTLGDGVSRSYAAGISYSSLGGLSQEQFGTTTPIYNKLNYNTRGQLAEMRASTAGGDDSWNRGKFINWYSLQCGGASCNATDNNGNLRKQETYIPTNDQNTSFTSWSQQYDYDSLNRLTQVHEYTGNTSLDWQQAYNYDRWGNRTIDGNSSKTYGYGINSVQSSIDANSNRMYAPGDLSISDPNQRLIRYDAGGNQTHDYYSASWNGMRSYDAENRMTSAASTSNTTDTYSYDGSGQRIKRNVNGVETWQVYGLGGELLAEYPANGNPSNPLKEYGYRNGQVLVTLTSPLPGGAPTFHDNPIQVGVTTVQALHITELRAAINGLRVHLGMSAYSWTTSATTNDYLSANPILEMRTALDQALGAPAGGYAAGLAQGQPVKAIHIQELRDRLTAASGSDIRWLVTDQLGTPRMIFDQSGSLANVSRHDYLPFGEELSAGQGLRTSTQGYAVDDGARQKFTVRSAMWKQDSTTCMRVTTRTCREDLSVPILCWGRSPIRNRSIVMPTCATIH